MRRMDHSFNVQGFTAPRHLEEVGRPAVVHPTDVTDG